MHMPKHRHPLQRAFCQVLFYIYGRFLLGIPIFKQRKKTVNLFDLLFTQDNFNLEIYQSYFFNR